MKTTKKNIESYVRAQLGSDQKWAQRALVRIFKENQTFAEQAAGMTTVDNGIGFTGTDGAFLSSLASQFIEKGFLTSKQMTFVFKAMPKYAKQVIKFSNLEKLTAMVSDFEYTSVCESEEARRHELRTHGAPGT